ncbi:MAG TPA: PIN domain-containing protein [Steroidobacteraceae bacterium]|nr:PIN domain-containing protein [Steroidobacteraceae bacterium]
MNDTMLLVDFENVGKIDLAAVPDGYVVALFFGAAQKSVPKEFLKAAVKLRERFVSIDIEGQGKNALDFHIAYYLGQYLTQSPKVPCVILSKDRGFDPLIKHLGLRGFKVRRANSLREACPPGAAVTRRPTSARESASVHVHEAALQWLSASTSNRRPRTRKALAAYLYSRFAKKITEEELMNLIERLIASGQLSEANGRIAYHF